MHPVPYSLLTASKPQAGVLNGLGPPVAFHLPGVTQLPASKNFKSCKWEISISVKGRPLDPPLRITVRVKEVCLQEHLALFSVV